MSARLLLLLVASLLVAAARSQAEVRHERFRSESLGTDVAVSVHLPPGYMRATAPLPVIYALHGLFESDGFWERRGLAEQLDGLWARRELPEFVLVAVDGGNSFFVDGPQGRFETLASRDVLAWAESHLRVRADRGGRGLLGISMGGYAALRIAFRQPTTFVAVATHSAMLLSHPPTPEEGAGRWHMAAFQRVFGTPIDTRLWEASDPLFLATLLAPAQAPALSFDCGAQDRYGLFAGHRRLHEILQARGVAHEFSLPPGDHGYDYVRAELPRSLRFLAGRWAVAATVTERPPAAPAARRPAAPAAPPR